MLNVSATQGQAQNLALTPQLRQGLKFLAMNLPELRAELQRELSANPVIDEIEPTLERTTVSDCERALADGERTSDYPDGDDALDEVFVAGMNRGAGGADPDALARRERFFENQVRAETLSEHLLAQLPLSDIEPGDQPLAELLIGDLDEDGYFAGSLADVEMVSGATEAKLEEVLAKIRALDPLGCGARSHQECLEAQLETIPDRRLRRIVGRLIRSHWQDMATGRLAPVLSDLGLTKEGYAEALRALRSLEPRPGRAFRASGRGDEYVNPEVHVERCSDGYLARVDARSLPEIRISPKYLAMLNDPATGPETRDYIREKIAAANAVREAVARRQETITGIAQVIFDAQPDFFVKGLKGLRPLTMQEVADRAGVHPATVSRTVRGKYAATPKGTVELRRFFTQGMTTESGEQVTKDAVLERLKALVEAEDGSAPLSDERLSALLKADGVPVARRTVAKYRGLLNIPGAAERRRQ